jgi:GAF domain-containing protein
MAKEIVSENKEKPVYDEQTLANVLEAAYILQEHNRELQEMERHVEPAARLGERGPAPSSDQTPGAPRPDSASLDSAPKDDYTAILAQIVETQHQIQVRHLDLEHAMTLIVERVIEITKAAGAGIGVLDGRMLRYRAATGLMTLPLGTEVPLEKALCSASLRVGDVIRCADVNSEFLIDAQECQRRGIQSLISVPVYHGGGIAGGLEVYYASAQAFTEPDVHSCQLMAGLVTEALARKEELAWKNSLASERAVMLEALEKLRPNLAALVDANPVKAAEKKLPESRGSEKTAAATPAPSAKESVCPKCKNILMEEEQFCGQCGLPRSGDYEPPSMQSKLASLLRMQDAAKKGATGSAATGASAGPVRAKNSDPPASTELWAESLEAEFPRLFELPQLPVDEAGAPAKPLQAGTVEQCDTVAKPKLAALRKAGDEEEFDDEEENEDEEETSETALAKPERAADWSSAAAAREFLEQLAGAKNSHALARFLSARRGDLYLAVAVILVACVVRWGIWSNHSVSATGSPTAIAAGHRRPAPDADLSLFDRMLVKLGLAEAPDPPDYKGNPDTQVWVDLQTALYYCPGADLYGKTPKGKMTSQRDAQLDQFEPASRKACE